MQLINVTLDSSYNIQASINIGLIIIPLLIIFSYIYCKFYRSNSILSKSFEINCAEIGMKDQKIQLKPNYEDAQIAYKLWVELSTRKIGLSIDYDNDVIIEIYNSWYEFFRITRELIKSVPINKIRKNESSYQLVEVAIEVLNEGIRPHLTKWQAKFRKWYFIESEKAENKGISPQELQKRFSGYEELIADMKRVNANLIRYKEILQKIAFG
jgi:hypothetical protein